MREPSGATATPNGMKPMGIGLPAGWIEESSTMTT